MPINPLGTILKLYRQQNQMSVRDVVLELSHKYNLHYKEQTVYGWESNQSHPSSETFVALCTIYSIKDVPEIFCEESNPQAIILTPEEKEIIKSYRENQYVQNIIYDVMGLIEKPLPTKKTKAKSKTKTKTKTKQEPES